MGNPGFDLLLFQHAVIVLIGGVEILHDRLEEFIERQLAIVIAIDPREPRWFHPLDALVLGHGQHAVLILIDEKKGLEPLILDLRGLTDIADYFVVVHGTSDRHVLTLADGVEDYLRTKKVKPLHVEGRKEATWILLDYGSVIVHVFHYETRAFYNLERLWGDAKIVKVASDNEKPVKRTRRRRSA